MSFPYITDILNAVLGTHWALPIPTFGVVVTAAIAIAAAVARIEVRRKESVGQLPASTHLIVGGAGQGWIGQVVVDSHAVQYWAHCAAKSASVALFNGTSAQLRQ